MTQSSIDSSHAAGQSDGVETFAGVDRHVVLGAVAVDALRAGDLPPTRRAPPVGARLALLPKVSARCVSVLGKETFALLVRAIKSTGTLGTLRRT